MKKILTIIFTVLGVIAVGFGGTKLYNANTLPTCDSKFAEDVLLELVKEEFRVYDRSDTNSIGVHDFVPVDYDNDIKKYSCRAIVTLGFNAGYEKRYAVGYEIYKERGENMVALNKRILYRD